ncbi:MAG: DUF4442 domain-containing protein [Deltaproteobacteria bacterium]|nr:DUF4442 domain-containing protein [Deltaproteobacteria bacterium]
MKPNLFKLLLNIYPPYWGTGILIKKIAPDYKKIIVTMKQTWYNGNYVKTHFGGSLFAMTDPFYMLMLIQILGKNYLVWDKTARIEFIKPGKGTVTAEFIITESQIKKIIENTANGEKYLPEFSLPIKDQKGDTVAIVSKTIYVRKKK